MSRFSIRRWLPLVLTLPLSAASVYGPPIKTPVQIGGFDSSRGGTYSFASGAGIASLRQLITSQGYFPNAVLTGSPTLTPEYLKTLHSIILMTPNGGPTGVITPLTPAEQTALYNWVLAGGTAILCVDNGYFAKAAPAANNNLVAVFGLSTDPAGAQYNAGRSNGTLTKVQSPVVQGYFQTAGPDGVYYAGDFTNLGKSIDLEDWSAPPFSSKLQPGVAYFPKGALGPTSGIVAFFSDAGSIGNGSEDSANQIMIANTIATGRLQGPGIQDTTAPFGSFDTPANNTNNVVGAVAVTGWALDNVGVVKVELYRDGVGQEVTGSFGKVYIGAANFVSGARPDVQQSYSNYPNAGAAGWGYQLLTNFLPGVGNGTYTLHAYAYDAAGNVTELGAPGVKITCTNSAAAKPFGSIDTPDQGGTASGAAFVNFGWALTPGASFKIPIDGSTMSVTVDGQTLGHPTYNQYRSDIATAFPGYTNSPGAVGYFRIDTTKLSNGVHTIAWLVYDNAGRGEGIGSRFFTVANAAMGSASPAAETALSLSVGVKFRRGFDLNRESEWLAPGSDGSYSVKIDELDHMELDLGAASGFSLVNDEHAELPVGSSFHAGIFYWQLGPGFLGEYQLVLVRPTGEEVRVHVQVGPKRFSSIRTAF